MSTWHSEALLLRLPSQTLQQVGREPGREDEDEEEGFISFLNCQY